MTPKEMLERLNRVANKLSDLEVTIKEAARDCRMILSEIEELPSEVDEIDFQEIKEEEVSSTEDFEPTT